MKKLLAILLSICLVFALNACQSETEITTTQTTTTQITTTQTTSSNQTTTAVTAAGVTIDEPTSLQEIDETSTTSVETTAAATAVSSTTTEQTTATTTNSTITTAPATAASSTATTTAATTTTKSVTTTATTSAQNYCYVTIDMTTAKDNLSAFTTAKASFIPSSGILLEKTKVYYTDGDTLFDAILSACSDNVCSDNCKYCSSSGIQIEYQYTPAYNSYYIEGVHQIYEMDGGLMSGWMVYVNNESIQSSASTIEIQNGDNIILAYTCSMGSDIIF
ncbi:MAG: DUF4430 domain-containing protein [Clostridia bacterium]